MSKLRVEFYVSWIVLPSARLVLMSGLRVKIRLGYDALKVRTVEEFAETVEECIEGIPANMDGAASFVQFYLKETVRLYVISHRVYQWQDLNVLEALVMLRTMSLCSFKFSRPTSTHRSLMRKACNGRVKSSKRLFHVVATIHDKLFNTMEKLLTMACCLPEMEIEDVLDYSIAIAVAVVELFEWEGTMNLSYSLSISLAEDILLNAKKKISSSKFTCALGAIVDDGNNISLMEPHPKSDSSSEEIEADEDSTGLNLKLSDSD